MNLRLKLFALTASICGVFTSLAVEPVATFADLSNGTKVGDYTVSGNCISGGTAWTYTDYITVIVKYSGLPTSGQQAIVTFHQADHNDKAGVIANASKAHGLWEGNAWGNDGSTVEASGTIVVVYAPSSSSGVTVYSSSGTQLYAASGLKASSGSFGDAINFGAKHDGSMKLSGFSVDAVQILKGAAQASEITALVAAFEEAIKPTVPAVEPLMLLNVHNGTAVDGWLNHTQNGGGAIPNSGSLTTNGISFVTSSEGNFFTQRASGTSFQSGEFIGLDGKTYDSIASEVSSSLGLPTGVVFDDTVYNTGVMNGGKINHTATLSGLDNSAKYLLYLGCGRDHTDADYQSGFKFETSGCASVDELAYVNTDSTSYQTGSHDNDMLSTTDGLVIVRAKGIKPVNGTIQFKMVGGRSSLNFLAVAKVNEIEEPEETETITYPATGFVTKTYQQTGWKVTIDEILQYGTLTPTMSGGYMKDRPVEGSAQFITKTTESGASVLSMQMQVVNDGHLKVVEVYLKDSDNGILIKATRAGHTTGAALGTNQTSFGDQVAENANADGYGVASVSLSITKPVDKSVKGTIDEVATAHSEDYTSNTITAKVTIENESEYKGAAVLVYALGETQYVSEIEKSSASITISGLEGGEVYRGTLALGQKIGEEVTVIEGTEQPVALYQGEQKFVWIASPFKIQDATLVNEAQGLTIENPFADPDYIDLCDSEYTVSISASETVDAENDAALDGTEQGGVRIAQTSGGLKLQVVVDGAWTDFANAAVDTTYTLKVKFHYKKSQEGETDATSVTYTLDSTSKTSTNTTGKLKVTEIFVSDGTNLAEDLFGACQLDKAVIVDIELKPGEGDTIDYNTEAEANAAIKTLKIGICDAVKNVLTTAEAQENYRKYFHLVVVPSKMLENGFSVKTEFTTDAKNKIEEELENALADVVNAFNTGSAEIVGKPGLYYGVKRGEKLDEMTVQDELKMAGADGKVSVTIAKPKGASKHFYRIICSPTPALNK